MTSAVSLPYTCGELVQGRLDGSDFHITCPVSRRGRVAVDGGGGAGLRMAQLPRKARVAARRMLAGSGVEIERLRFLMPQGLSAGKGLASSSVDVLGVILALSRWLGQSPTAAEASQSAIAIEPTDGIAFAGIAFFDHSRGERQRHLGAALPLGIIVIEPPGTVDTVAFHRRYASHDWARGAGLWRDAVAMVEHGLATGDEATLAQAATLSAWEWERFLPNPWLGPAAAWGRAQGAIGICRAHSGSVLGLLFPAARDLGAPAAALRRLLPVEAGVWTTALANGGAR